MKEMTQRKQDDVFYIIYIFIHPI